MAVLGFQIGQLEHFIPTSNCKKKNGTVESLNKTFNNQPQNLKQITQIERRPWNALGVGNDGAGGVKEYDLRDPMSADALAADLLGRDSCARMVAGERRRVGRRKRQCFCYTGTIWVVMMRW